MIVKVDLDRNDIWNFNKYAMLKMPSLRRNLIINLMAAPITTFLILLFSRNLINLPMIVVIILTIIGGFLGDLVLIYITKTQIMKSILDKSGLLGEHTIEINEKGIKESTSVNEGFHVWEGIYRIEESKDYIFIFLDTIMAHIVPKKAFNTVQEANEFYQKSFDYWKKSKVVS